MGRWLSVDALAEKYPSLSPYVYAVNNPVKFIDPNGKYLYDSSKGERISPQKAIRLLKRGIEARYEKDKENSYIGFYEKFDWFDWFEPGWKRSQSLMHGKTIEFTEEAFEGLISVNVSLGPDISPLISEIEVFKDEANSTTNREIWVIRIRNEENQQIAQIVGTREQIEKFLGEFDRNLKTGNVLKYSDEEKWKRLKENRDLETKNGENDNGDTGWEAEHRNPPR